MDKRRFKANIQGKEYIIMGQKSAYHLDAVVDILNHQISQLADLDPNLSVADRSILIAINAISDQLSKEEQVMELETELAKYSGQKENAQISSQQKGAIHQESLPLDQHVPFERE